MGTSPRDIYQQLLKLQNDRQPFDVTTGKRHYKNMLLRSLDVTTDNHSENVLMCILTLREVSISQTYAIAVAHKENMAAGEAMRQNWIRHFEIQLLNNNGVGVNPSDFKVTFKIEWHDINQPRIATDIKIYNLSSDTTNNIIGKEYSKIRIIAGQIGRPQQTMGTGVNVRCLINPNIRLNGLIQLDQASIYRIVLPEDAIRAAKNKIGSVETNGIITTDLPTTHSENRPASLATDGVYNHHNRGYTRPGLVYGNDV